MPIISRFYGIVIRMYFMQAEHNPPHVHAIYGNHTAEITIQDGTVLEGNIPPKALSMVREWIDLNKYELMQIWNTQQFHYIKPLT